MGQKFFFSNRFEIFLPEENRIIQKSEFLDQIRVKTGKPLNPESTLIPHGPGILLLYQEPYLEKNDPQFKNWIFSIFRENNENGIKFDLQGLVEFESGESPEKGIGTILITSKEIQKLIKNDGRESSKKVTFQDLDSESSEPNTGLQAVNIQSGKRVNLPKKKGSTRFASIGEISIDGKYYAVSLDRHIISIVDLESGSQWQINLLSSSPGQDEASLTSINELTVSNSSLGPMVATLRESAGAKIYFAKTGEMLKEAYVNPQGSRRNFYLTPGGNYLLLYNEESEDENSELNIWDLRQSEKDLIDNLLSLSNSELISQACRVVGRNLTMDEWEQYFGGLEKMTATCPDNPLSKDRPS